MTIENIKESLSFLDGLELSDKVKAINEIRKAIHEKSPFKSEPVDFIEWVESGVVHANDYNPNSVAPPEMELLRTSIMSDGYTQPIVTNQEEGKRVVVDGFHRNRVGKECLDVRERIKGYLPVVQIRSSQTDKNNRMASTIRHNRARGKHSIDAMSDIVIELKNRNWTNERVAKELGMEPDEVLRLCQITGLAELFSDDEFSRAWDVEGSISESDFVELTDSVDDYEDEIHETKTANVNDEKRVFHTYDKWECHKAGFYATTHPEYTKQECMEKYAEFLSNLSEFERGLIGVTSEWKHSCEHYLTNDCLNRIAWLGQAACCYVTGIPSEFRSGFGLLTKEQQNAANDLALKYLNKWLAENGIQEVTMDVALGGGRQSVIY